MVSTRASPSLLPSFLIISDSTARNSICQWEKTTYFLSDVSFFKRHQNAKRGKKQSQTNDRFLFQNNNQVLSHTHSMLLILAENYNLFSGHRYVFLKKDLHFKSRRHMNGLIRFFDEQPLDNMSKQTNQTSITF